MLQESVLLSLYFRHSVQYKEVERKQVIFILK